VILTVDFETYYDKEYSLKRLTTEEYIRDDRFKVHGVGLKSGDQPSVYIWTDVKGFLNQIDWSTAFVLCHNTRFDGAILSWRYGIRPKFLLDTLSLSRAVFPHESGSLANLSKLCGLGEKGNDLVNFAGKRDLTEEEQVALGLYCMNDVDLTYKLFQTMKSKFAPSELKVIDQTLRMFTEPILELDDEVLFNHLQKIQAKQAKLLDGRDLTGLRSNPQFAKQLVALGVDPPTKISARTQKVTFAFAKTDEGMLSLLEHENVEVQALAAARLGVKSSIEETRTKAFLGISERGKLPIALNYFGAQNTGRFAGGENNPQNLPRGGELRKAIIAPAGHVLVVSDFSQIEARMIAWLAGQEELLQQFRDGDDVYCRFASKVYGRTITKEDKTARFLGKICILALGYSLGWRKLATILATGPMGQAPILFTAEDLETMDGRMEKLDTKGITTKLTGQALAVHCSAAKHLVDTYRNSYDRIPNYWQTCERILSAMHRGVAHQFGCISTEKDCVLLPNGLYLQYKDLRKDEEGSWRYTGKRGEKQYIYGGKLAENLTQALSRIVMTDAMLKIPCKAVMSVHDELVYCVREEEAEEAADVIEAAMSVAPAWCKDLPVACEVGISKSYGEAK
jgi:DNA polymerase